MTDMTESTRYLAFASHSEPTGPSIAISVMAQPNLHPMDPEDEAHLRKNPDCIPPLGVATVFQEPVSVLQISRVLNLEPEVTLKRLRTMSRHLDHPLDDDVYSVVAIKESPRKWIFSRAESGRLCLALTEYNNRVAQWCLADANNYDVRDIEYATKYWIYHICQSIPSQMRCKTIMTSRFVDLRSWSKKLEEIKTWLRKYSDSDDFAVFGVAAKQTPPTFQIGIKFRIRALFQVHLFPTAIMNKQPYFPCGFESRSPQLFWPVAMGFRGSRQMAMAGQFL
ncbi:hypothetical protein B0H11DRAFT_1912078 [Mycena galericulata]|nr:hypothetical protein B0H11DRAFT_1912078 [Mycena galericulata]